MDREGVAAVFWGELEAAARFHENARAKINLDALQAYALAYLAARVDSLTQALDDVKDRIDALKGI